VTSSDAPAKGAAGPAGAEPSAARQSQEAALRPVPFLRNRPLQAIAAAYAAVWLWSAVAPKYRSDWLLENLLIFAFVPLLAATYRRFRFSNVSYGLIAAFLALHSYGAHYTYSETPFGFWLKDTLDLSRNHYDRLVHFGFGLFMTYPVRELGLRVLHLRGGWSWSVPFLIVLALSADYELVESWVARIVSPDLGIAFLGIQGDVWDAQKDMNAAQVGGLAALAIAWAWWRWRGREAWRG
jgi:putative membrane protein